MTDESKVTTGRNSEPTSVKAELSSPPNPEIRLYVCLSPTSGSNVLHLPPQNSTSFVYSNVIDVKTNETLTIVRVNYDLSPANSSYSSSTNASIFLESNNTWFTLMDKENSTPDKKHELDGPLKFKIGVKSHLKTGYPSSWHKPSLTVFYSIRANPNVNSGTLSTNQRYATVIPENSKTSVNVILEQSTDLVNWSTVSPGQFSSSASKRFFRVRSANVPVSLTGATNASPIVITSTAHLLNTGDTISISGVVGNTAANGIFTITKVDANSFSLNGSTGNGAYSSGGTWLPNP